MAFNPELSFKVLERRVDALEKAADRLEVASRAAGDCKAAKAVSDRVTKLEAVCDRLPKLEAVVKALAESRLDTKVDAMNKTLLALNNANLVDKDTMQKLWNDRSAKVAEEHARDAKAIADKAVAEGMKAMEVARMETRLAQLEAKMMAMIAAAAAR